MGVLQISKGLDFLHQSAELLHANLTPWTVLTNAAVSLSSAYIVARDLKIAGLAPLTSPTGSPTRLESRDYHSSLDYMGTPAS